MNLVEALRDRLTQVAPGDEPGIDLNDIWAAAGRPKGRSPRSWRRSTLGKAAIDLFASRRGGGPDAIFHHPRGPKAHVEADPAVAVIYIDTLDSEAAEAELDALDRDDLADVRRLLSEEAQRKAVAELEREPYRMPINAIDRVRSGVVDPWAGPDARPGDPRLPGAPPWGSPDHLCSDCNSKESVFLASASPERWLCHVCRRR